MGCNLCTQLDPNLPDSPSNMKKIKRASNKKKQRRMSNQVYSENPDSNPFDQENSTLSSNDDSEDQMDEIYLSKLQLQKESKLLFHEHFNLSDCKFSSFSQKRFIGFRKHFEFDAKRLVIANQFRIKVLSIKQTNMKNQFKKSNDKNSTYKQSYLSQGGALFCCQNNENDFFTSSSLNVTDYQNLSSSRDRKLRLDTSSGNDNIKQICEWQIPHKDSKEEIIFAGFLEDINPDFILVVTKNIEKPQSRFYILRIDQKLGDIQQSNQILNLDDSYNKDNIDDFIENGLDSPQYSDDDEIALKDRLKQQLINNKKDFRMMKSTHDENFNVEINQNKLPQIFEGDNEISLKYDYITDIINQEKGINQQKKTFNSQNNNQNGGKSSDQESNEVSPSKLYLSKSICLQKAKRFLINTVKVFDYNHLIFEKVFFSNNNIYGKIMFTVDQHHKMRVHLFKDLEEQKGFGKDYEDDFTNSDHLKNIKIKEDFIQSRCLTLKYENNATIRENDGPFLQNGQSDNNFTKLAKLEIKRIDCFADFIFVIYQDRLFFDIFKKSGTLVERKYICSGPNVKIDILQIDRAILPRLEWSDRYVDIIQQSNNELGKKFIVSGMASQNNRRQLIQTIQNKNKATLKEKSWAEQSFGAKSFKCLTPKFEDKGFMFGDEETFQGNSSSLYCRPFIMIYDRIKNQPLIIKLIQSNSKITQLKYGPYDNGHIIAGLSNGIILAFSQSDLTKLYQYKLYTSQISEITFDPSNYLIATSHHGEVAAISLIENKVKYVYLELDQKKYCTVQMPLLKAKGKQHHNTQSQSNITRLNLPKQEFIENLFEKS
ncbi:UNKNOWN [Stylonychia lemnae]|uniref:Uncharacterized protein n=1 Tax=Stylonychia lemnae TaxID=5949 RepID=A0A078A092_STYLE|nr:UNKNOWN [Stylonychia lemnae]|eukprot:CDW74843.1 UNKNOWN [Stylonychia lemnae]